MTLFITSAIQIFLCTFTLTFLAGFQSQNIAGRHKRMSFITSAIMGLVSLITLKMVSGHTDMLTNIAYIFGGPFGIVASLKFHPVFKQRLPKLFKKKGVPGSLEERNVH